jgi:hypothetical protein
VKISDIRVDAAKIEAGDWVGDLTELFPGLEGVRLKVRGSGNADYRRLQAKKLRKVAAARLGPDKEQEAALQVTNELLAETILLDWDGILQEDGVTPLAYTKELSAQLLADPEMRIFREAVIYAGNLVASRKKETTETAEKN